MAVLKCKMCGGDLQADEGAFVTECEYCGSVQTIPTLDDEKKLVQFERAERLRKQCEFDKAAGIYESIVSDFREESEAYWGLVLCKYGIEYVDDPVSGKKVPTCHRSSFDSIMEDSDLEQALENADITARRVYREEAKRIEEIRRGIVSVSSSEKPYDIFICYKETDENGERTIDSVIAQDTYDALTDKGYRVFFSRITLEDKLGAEYEPYIFAALNSAKIMLAFGTKYEYFHSVWVKNEWSRFLALAAKDKTKVIIPCYKDMDAYDMPDEFKALQAQDMGKVGAMQDLLRGIEKILPKKESTTVITERVVVGGSADNKIASLLKRAFMFLEDGEWNSANEYCEKVLDIDPECAEAYLGKLMVNLKVRTQNELINCNKPFDNYNSYQKAIRFGSENLKAELEGCVEQIKSKIEIAAADEIYCKAVASMEAEAYQFAIEQFESILNYKDSALRASKCAEKLNILKEKLAEKRKQIKPFQKLLAVGAWESFGVTSEGTVKSSLDDSDGNRYYDWEDVVAIDSLQESPAALFSDGTVKCDYDVEDEENYADVLKWKNIVDISCGLFHLTGIKKDGTVLSVDFDAETDVDCAALNSVIECASGNDFTVGLCEDGTVLCTGKLDQIVVDKVKKWDDIVAVSCGDDHVIGLKSDGSVVAAGYNEHGQCNVQSWKNIVAVSAGYGYSVGLTVSGTVVVTDFVGDREFYRGQCDKYDWNDIIAIKTSPSSRCVLGLKLDGTVLAQGENDDNQCSAATRWKLFNNMENYEEECRIARQKRREYFAIKEREKQEELRRQEELRKLQSSRRASGLCQHCGGTFKGFFTKKCTSCGKPKDY